MNPMRKWLYVVIGRILYSGVATAAVLAVAVANHAVTCLNNAGAARNGVTAADAKAHIDFALGLEKFTNIIAHRRPTAADVARLATVSATYESVLAADQAYRDKNPLGAC